MKFIEYLEENSKTLEKLYVIGAVGYVVIHIIVAICSKAPGFDWF